jgi:hypothetical protein
LLVTVTASATSGQNLYLKRISANSLETHNHPFALHEAKKKVFKYVESWMGIAADFSAINCSNTHGSGW